MHMSSGLFESMEKFIVTLIMTTMASLMQLSWARVLIVILILKETTDGEFRAYRASTRPSIRYINLVQGS